MKKFTLCLITAMMMFIISEKLEARTDVAVVSTDSTKTIESTEIKELIYRLDEIKAMDKSKLSSMEKKQLRKEVRSIKSELRGNSGGVYISVGALLVVIVLLILLL